MNENNDYNSGNVKPYKATANLNTAIANPSINVNDAMDINIQNFKTNNPSINNISNNTTNQGINNSNLSEPSIKANETINKNISSNINNNVSPVELNIVNNTNSDNKNQNNTIKNETITNTTTNNDFVKKTYVTKDNKPKKKKVLLNMGPEFKIGLLIIVILLTFILVLPILSDLIMGY